MGIPWNAIGTFHVEWHGLLLCLAHGDQPMGIPWNAIGTFHVEWHGMLLCLAHGDQPMGNPWNAIGAPSLVDSMAWLYG